MNSAGNQGRSGNGFRFRSWIVPLSLALLGLILRLWTLKFTTDFPGDAQARTVIALKWLLNPHWVRAAYWLPFPCYETAFLLSIFKDPLNTPRLTSAILGSLAIPVLYFYAKRLFGQFVAVTSAVALVFFPLSVGLCASSLTEAQSITFALTAFLLLMKATSPKDCSERKRNLYLILSVLLMLILIATRAESWAYIPFFAAYFYLSTGKTALSLILFALLSIFPNYWLISCWSDYHLPLISFSGNTEPRIVSPGVINGVILLGWILVRQLGPLVFGLAVAGYFIAAKMVLKKESRPENWREIAFLLALTTFLTLLDMYFTCQAGEICQDRYLILLMTLLIPLAMMALSKVPYFAVKIKEGAPKPQRIIAATLAALLVSNTMLGAFMWLKPQVFVSKSPPEDLIAAGNWLKETGNEDKSIVETSIDMWAYYLHLVCPAIVPHTQVVLSYWMPLLDIRDALVANPPVFLVTGVNDQPDLDVLKCVVKFEVQQPPVFKRERVSIYKIVPGSFSGIENPKLPLCLWYPPQSLRTLFQQWKRRDIPPEL